MITFRTQFPINKDKDIADIVDAGRVWLEGSPHSKLSGVMNFEAVLADGSNFMTDDESITFRVYDEAEKLAAFRYEKLDPSGVRWVTEVASCKLADEFWVSVQLSADSELPVEKVGQGKRPYILKNIMRNIGGGMDGKLPVSDIPYYLDENEVDFAADLINAKAGCMMPVVYVSATDDDATYVNQFQLSQWLSGMAHVVVEPSRAFSYNLMHKVCNENAYGGAVAIYWPDGVGRWLFLPKDEFADSKKMQMAISNKVRSSLLSQRLKKECRWGYIQEKVTKSKLQALKESGSDKVDEYVALFDKELEAKEEEIQRLEAEVSRLKYGKFEVSNVQSNKNSIVLNSSESDLYQAERISILVDALSYARDSAETHSRRSDVLSDFIERNSQIGERESILKTMKSILKSYKSLSSSLKKELDSLGFDVREDGKHYKLIFRGDERYSFTLSKTGSDHRGGMNAYTDLKKRLF